MLLQIAVVAISMSSTVTKDFPWYVSLWHWWLIPVPLIMMNKLLLCGDSQDGHQSCGWPMHHLNSKGVAVSNGKEFVSLSADWCMVTEQKWIYCSVRLLWQNLNVDRWVWLPYGYDGAMYAPGKHIHACSRDKPYGDYYQPQLCMLSKFLQSLLSSCFHWKTLSIQCGLEGYDKKPPKGGDKGLAKSVNILVSLLIQHNMIQMMMAVVLGFGLRKTNISVQTFILLCLIFWWKT